MSTKTLRKRIALVAVSALTAGLVSVVAVPAANAAAGDITGVTGVGLLASTTTGTSTTQTATLLSTGSLTIATDTSAGYFVVSAGAYVSTASGGTIATDQKKWTASGSQNFTVTPTGAAGTTFTVTGYSSDSSGVVVDVLTVTIAGASVSGVLSPADSTLAWVTNGTTSSSTDESGKNTALYNNPLWLNVQLLDAYAAEITTPGALVATVTGDAVVAFGGIASGSGTTAAPSAASKGTFTTSVTGLNPSNLTVRIDEKTAGTGWSGSVTITMNGVVVGTKTGKITGAPASIAVTPKKIGKVGSNASAWDYAVKDAAGNELATTATTIVLSKSSDTSVVSGAVGSVNSVPSSLTVGKGDITCVKAGTAKVTVQITTNGVVTKSNEFTVTCGGAAYSYSAGFDKAVYAQGEIATLKVTFKDALGNLANSYDKVSVASTLNESIAAPMLTRVGGDLVAADATVDVKGQVVHTFTVGSASGTTAGKYAAVVKYGAVDVPTTVSYEVTTGGGVSNADVLKAIVSLIASINKQIAALQKALLRR